MMPLLLSFVHLLTLHYAKPHVKSAHEMLNSKCQSNQLQNQNAVSTVWFA